MGLIISQPPSWGGYTSSITGTPTTVPGTTVIAGASNADGTTVAILTALAHRVELLEIYGIGFSSTGLNTSTLLDIMVDPAGGTTWDTTPLIPDLLVGESQNPGGGAVCKYEFPIHIPSGWAIGARARNASAGTLAGKVIINAFGQNMTHGSFWAGSHVEAIGINAATSQGTNHTPGNTGAFSTWTNFGSTLPYPCRAICFVVQGTNTDVTQNAAQYHFEFGVAGARIGPPIWKETTTAEKGGVIMSCLIYCSLPAGTQLQVRGTCSGTAEVLDVAAYAIS